MRRSRLDVALDAVRAFSAAATRLMNTQTSHSQYEHLADFFEGGKDAAAVRRASMDLTRALADLRKGD